MATTIQFVCDELHDNYEEILPYLTQPADVETQSEFLAVPDSLEGMLHTIGSVIDSKAVSGHRSMVIDLTDVKAAGEPYRGSERMSCGPGPFVVCLQALLTILNS